MPRFYIEAYDKNDLPILGNLDGQASILAIKPHRTNAWKDLGVLHPHSRVAFWLLVNEHGSILGRKTNFNHT